MTPITSSTTPTNDKQTFYFGCKDAGGHELWGTKGKRVRYDWKTRHFDWPGPWQDLDGALYRDGAQGRATLHHKDGWTCIDFPDRTIDKRGGSHSAFFFEDTLTFDEAVSEAKRRWPNIFDRFDFEIVEDTHTKTSS